MRNILQYFDLITGVVEHSGAESAEMELDEGYQTTGIVDGVVYFYDGSRLEFTETVTIEHRRPIKLFYRYQYIRTGKAIFRYDNAPHHPNLPNFPHHKHVGGRKLLATEPALSQILDEVIALLGEGVDVPLPAPKRRRRSKR